MSDGVLRDRLRGESLRRIGHVAYAVLVIWQIRSPSHQPTLVPARTISAGLAGDPDGHNRAQESGGGARRGLSDKEIAGRFHIGVGTVRNHIVNIFSKPGVHSRLQALVFAVRHGVVEIS
jgi:hypothetical protein